MVVTLFFGVEWCREDFFLGGDGGGGGGWGGVGFRLGALHFLISMP